MTARKPTPTLRNALRELAFWFGVLRRRDPHWRCDHHDCRVAELHTHPRVGRVEA